MLWHKYRPLPEGHISPLAIGPTPTDSCKVLSCPLHNDVTVHSMSFVMTQLGHSITVAMRYL
jgi:hypothetical protein